MHLETQDQGVARHEFVDRQPHQGEVSEAAVGRLHEATGRPVLMEALHKGDTNGNGKIEVAELAAHVERRVPELFTELKANGWVVKGVIAAAERGIAVHHGTVARVLAQAGLPRIGAPSRPSRVDHYLPFILGTLEKFPTRGARGRIDECQP
jgi:hypothetical protein